MEDKITTKSFLRDGSTFYEAGYDPDQGGSGYCYWEGLTNESGFTPSVVIDGVEFMPPQNNLAVNGTMLFPSKVEDYKSFTDLLENISTFIDHYVELPKDYLLIVSCYVILSWVYDCFDTIPYLRARGDYGTGKSRFLKVIGSICYRPLFAGGSSTTSPIFRLIELYGGLTLVFDEADFRFSGPDAEIIKILNTGYQKGMGVLRTEGEKVRVPTSFNTYGPKILATRKEFDDLALESRCLTNYMTGMTRKDIPIALPKSFNWQAQSIRNQLLKFRFDNYGEYEVNEADRIDGIEPRINQILLPLLALTDSEVVRDQLREFALKHAKTQANSRGSTLEADILFVMLTMAKDDLFLSIKQISTKVNENRNKDQGEYLINPSKVGRTNKVSFGFETRRVNGVTEVIWNKKIAERLCIRFGVKLVEEVDLVDHGLTTQETAAQGELLENTREALL